MVLLIIYSFFELIQLKKLISTKTK